ncbi:choice-of-anchor J domain-containing protein [Oxalobacteraceae bacterium OTU3CAMAD1]|nr:choice-of-anchor J domain-containing protein [Oxalobacteraceae bacterium OTU3CAMAD1]
MAVPFKSALISAFALALTLGLSSGASADPLTENFDAGVPAGWTVNNLSQPPGTLDWFQGNEFVFPAQQGAPNSYLAANFESGGEVSTISTWLILPTSTYRNGDTLSFYSRTADFSEWPDRLEVRFSNVGGTDVGTTATSVGTFSTLLISINSALTVGGYPEEWTRYSATLSGLTGPTSGAFAFRYTVTDGGLFGANSNYIGIDTVQITAVPEPSVYMMMAFGLGMVGYMRRRQSRA